MRLCAPSGSPSQTTAEILWTEKGRLVAKGQRVKPVNCGRQQCSSYFIMKLIQVFSLGVSVVAKRVSVQQAGQAQRYALLFMNFA